MFGSFYDWLIVVFIVLFIISLFPYFWLYGIYKSNCKMSEDLEYLADVVEEKLNKTEDNNKNQEK